MAYDGIYIKLQIDEIKDLVLNEHIYKITQKSHKEIDFHIHKNSKNYILSLSANPNFPYILLSTNDTNNLPVPPSFCMLLRKYLQGAKINNISQVDNIDVPDNSDIPCIERIIKIDFENINESGNLTNYKIYFEVMGKYSNILITDNDNTILDVLIKSNIEHSRLNAKEKYTTKEVANKSNIFIENFDTFLENINKTNALSNINGEQFDLSSTISQIYAGLSKTFVLHLILEYLKKNNIHTEDTSYEILNRHFQNGNEYKKLFDFIKNYISDTITNKSLISPTINYKSEKPSDFYVYKLNSYQGEIIKYNTLNKCLEEFISKKYQDLNDTQDKKNIQTIIKNLYAKLNKKLDIYNKDLSKCQNATIYKTYGELISCYGYDNDNIVNGILTCKDYNNNDEIVHIPIDETLSIAQNVEKYYNKFNKLKRTKESAEKLISETNDKLEHLNSIQHSLELSNDKNDIYMIKEEIVKYFSEANKMQGLSKNKNDIRARNALYKISKKSNINYNLHHYKSSSGIDIYVGKNNLQNEYLTFTIANPNDTWFHIKNATGSHVIVKKSYEELDDKTLVEAASLAAYFSEYRNETKATVDYTLRKELKKVKGKAPGFCIYHKNYSINVKPELILKEI